jgi:hypothetical protein
VTFSVVDGHGNIQPDDDVTDGLVSVHLTGPALLLGDALFPLSSGSVWVRTIGLTGDVVVSIKHMQYPAVDVAILVKR